MYKKLSGLIIISILTVILASGCSNKDVPVTEKERESIQETNAASQGDSETKGVKQSDTQPDTLESITIPETENVRETGSPTTLEGGYIIPLKEKSLADFSGETEELIINAGGTSLVFGTDSTLKDFNIIGVNYNGDQLEEVRIYLHRDELTPDDGILITAVIPEGLPDLMVSYLDNNHLLKKYFITYGSDDGSVILLEESQLLFSDTTDSEIY